MRNNDNNQRKDSDREFLDKLWEDEKKHKKRMQELNKNNPYQKAGQKRANKSYTDDDF